MKAIQASWTVSDIHVASAPVPASAGARVHGPEHQRQARVVAGTHPGSGRRPLQLVAMDAVPVRGVCPHELLGRRTEVEVGDERARHGPPTGDRGGTGLLGPVEREDRVDIGVVARQRADTFPQQRVRHLVVVEHGVEDPPLVPGRPGQDRHGRQRPPAGGHERVLRDQLAVDRVVEGAFWGHEARGDLRLRVEDLLHRGAQAIEAIVVSERGEELPGDVAGRFGGTHALEPAALEDGPVEEPARPPPRRACRRWRPLRTIDPSR